MRSLSLALVVLCSFTAAMAGEDLFPVTGIYATDTRPEVWMFVDPRFACPPCERAKRELLTLECPLRVVVKPQAPANVAGMVTSYPTFYWTVGSVANRPFHYGYSGLAPLMESFEKSRGVKSKAFTPDEFPTPQSEVDRVIRLLPKPQIGFVEFGCGSDARWCVAAVQHWGCRAIGIEIDPVRAYAARAYVKDAGLDGSITIIEGDATTTDVQSDVGAVYLYDEVLVKLKPRLEKLRSFASYMHQPPGLMVTKNGDSWIYTQPARVPLAVWGGHTYTGPVCNDPRCGMCNAIRSQLNAR